MNQIVSHPPVLVKCKKCGAKYVYTPPSCGNFPSLTPLSVKGWIATFKNLFKSNKNKKEEIDKKEEKNIITRILQDKKLSFLICPICEGDLEKLYKPNPKSN